jgi:aryl-alcohol dehydrogenase-like predicted oxidoreductase
MKKRILGKDLSVSAIGLGCMGFTHAYGVPTNEKDAGKSIAAAVEAGYTFFDTAECYIGKRGDGSTAYNEELVGRVLRQYRNETVIATKFGVKHASDGTLLTDSSPDSIRKAVDGSLKRLGADHIDLYYQHRIDPKVSAKEVADTMKKLIAEGKISHWGVSEASEEYLRAVHAVCPVTCVQNRYSMMARWHESLFSVLEELNIGFVAFSPLANGILTGLYHKGDVFPEGDYRNLMPQYSSEAYEENRELLALINHMAQEKHATPSQISLAWMINKKPYIVPIPGSRKIGRILENGAAADIELTAAEVSDIDSKLENMKISGVFGGMAIKE